MCILNSADFGWLILIYEMVFATPGLKILTSTIIPEMKSHPTKIQQQLLVFTLCEPAIPALFPPLFYSNDMDVTSTQTYRLPRIFTVNFYC